MSLKRNKSLALIIIIALACVIMLLAYGAHMSDALRGSKKVDSHASLYQKQADKICLMLDQAMQYYKKGNTEKAYSLSEDAYWNVYDNILEIKYRPYATPAHIFSVESQFHAISDLMHKPITSKNLKVLNKKITTLCSEVNKQADELEYHP